MNTPGSTASSPFARAEAEPQYTGKKGVSVRLLFATFRRQRREEDRQRSRGREVASVPVHRFTGWGLVFANSTDSNSVYMPSLLSENMARRHMVRGLDAFFLFIFSCSPSKTTTERKKDNRSNKIHDVRAKGKHQSQLQGKGRLVPDPHRAEGFEPREQDGQSRLSSHPGYSATVHEGERQGGLRRQERADTLPYQVCHHGCARICPLVTSSWASLADIVPTNRVHTASW